jgi:hypothetical protein
MNVLLRTVKRLKTAMKIAKGGNVTIFYVVTYGRNSKNEFQANIISDSCYEIYEGTFYNYQRELPTNKAAFHRTF